MIKKLESENNNLKSEIKLLKHDSDKYTDLLDEYKSLENE